MHYGRVFAFSTLAVVTSLVLPADGQSVISTRSGVVHFFEGAVYLGDQPLEPQLGKFPRIVEGAELRTGQGRAEVLLTPGVFLRIGDGSSIRMLRNDLSDTRVELLAGSAIVDSVKPNADSSVTLIYRNWRVHFLERGVYRIYSEPPRLWVRQGEVEVSTRDTGASVSVEKGMSLPFAAVLVPEPSIDEPGDSLTNWAKGRSESVSADNAIAEQIDEDSVVRNSRLALDSFSYFPFIGVPSLSLGLPGAYSSPGLYQPGFNSIYLPGYTYRPLLLGLAPLGVRNYLHSPQRRIGVSPAGGAIVPAPVVVGRPLHSSPHGGVHSGIRR